MDPRPEHTGHESAVECVRWAEWWTREAERQHGHPTRVAEAEHHARYWSRMAGPVTPELDSRQTDLLTLLEGDPQ